MHLAFFNLKNYILQLTIFVGSVYLILLPPVANVSYDEISDHVENLFGS
jgi:hypothetical protein